MSWATDRKTLSQLEGLASKFSIQLERVGLPTEFELTVYYREDGRTTHAHVGGATLAETVNRAHLQFVAVPKRSEGSNE